MSQMQTPAPDHLSFDPDFYFNLVAENLLRSFGDRALFYADEALRKMKLMGDEDGFQLWLSIHEHLTLKAADFMNTGEASSQTLH